MDETGRKTIKIHQESLLIKLVHLKDKFVEIFVVWLSLATQIEMMN